MGRFKLPQKPEGTYIFFLHRVPADYFAVVLPARLDLRNQPPVDVLDAPGAGERH